MWDFPDRFEPVPPDFDGPCFLEVLPEHRGGRGRWWCPGAQGYTDDVSAAGLYPAVKALGSERTRAVSAEAVADALEAAWKDLGQKLSTLRSKELRNLVRSPA